MKREQRKEFLCYLEKYLLESNKSLSRVAYESTCGWNRIKVHEIKKIFRKIHPMDFKNKYPNAVNLLVRICYPKKRDYWGRKAEQKTLSIKEMASRKHEFIRRSKNLINNSSVSEMSDILDVIMFLFNNKDRQEIIARLDKNNDNANSLLLALSVIDTKNEVD